MIPAKVVSAVTGLRAAMCRIDAPVAKNALVIVTGFRHNCGLHEGRNVCMPEGF